MANPEFGSSRRTLSGGNVFSEQYADALFQNRGVIWGEQMTNALVVSREQMGPYHKRVVATAISDILHQIPSDGSFIDWGIGSGPFYPNQLPENSKLTLYALDRDVDAVRSGILNGRIPHDSILINSSAPPYNEIPAHTVDAVIGISVFHMMGNLSGKNIFEDLVENRLKLNGSIICHVQDITPSGNFWMNVDEKTLRQMGNYLREQYQLKRLVPGQLRRNDETVWQKAYARSQQSVMSSISQGYLVTKQGEIEVSVNEITATPLPDLENFYENAFRLDGLNRSDNVVQINRLSSGLKPDIRGLVELNKRMGGIVCGLPEIAFRDSEMKTFLLSLYQAISAVNHDLFEAYLVIMMERLGMSVSADRSTLVMSTNADGGHSNFVHTIDGHTRGDAIAVHNPGLIHSVRRVVGRV